MTELKDLIALKKMLDAVPLKLDGETAELVDEDDPEGNVVIKTADGTPTAVMPRNVWDFLRNGE